LAEDLGDKTEMPTSRRRREARGRGQVAKSPDFGSAVDLTGGFLALVLMGGSIVAGLTSLLRYLLDDRTSGHAVDMASVDGAVRLAGVQLVVIAGPFMLVMFAISYFAQFMQVGWLFTLTPIQPKLDRLNPMSGVSRLFSRRNAVKTAVGVAKMTVLATVGVMVVRSHMGEIAALPRLTAGAAFLFMGKIIADLCIWMLAIMLVIGITDYLYQRWQHTKDMKMTKQEVKDEFRSMEGDVETKGRRLRMARQIALQRIKQSVPKADVVVTNPTHFAVALQYDPKGMAAPKVVAKGADFMAFRIREIAAANGIPIVEKPPLARALYAEVDVGRTISPEFYEAVAEILAYVYRLQGKAPVAA
jgi:flagellar biosynthetic protein FlhB